MKEEQVLIKHPNTPCTLLKLKTALTEPLLCGSWRDNSQKGFQVQLAKNKQQLDTCHEHLSPLSSWKYPFLFFFSWRWCRGVQSLKGGARSRPSLVLQSDHQDLERLLHQLLVGVREQQVVVWDAVAHGVVAAHHVEQGCEERQGVSAAGKQSVQAVRANEDALLTCYLRWLCIFMSFHSTC